MSTERFAALGATLPQELRQALGRAIHARVSPELTRAAVSAEQAVQAFQQVTAQSARTALQFATALQQVTGQAGLPGFPPTRVPGQTARQYRARRRAWSRARRALRGANR